MICLNRTIFFIRWSIVLKILNQTVFESIELFLGTELKRIYVLCFDVLFFNWTKLLFNDELVLLPAKK